MRWLNFIGAVCLTAAGAAQAQEERPLQPLNLQSLPLQEWLDVGPHAQIPWDSRVREPYLRMDQRVEVLYLAQIDAKELNRTGNNHEVFLIARISSPDGEWLTPPNISGHQLDQQLPKQMELQFTMRIIAQPGPYKLWMILYDRVTGKHNLATHRFRVPGLRGDPLPDLYRKMPRVEIATVNDPKDDANNSLADNLNLSVANKRPLNVELISMLSAPEQWTGRSRMVRPYNYNIVSALAALSQLQLSQGALSITGLDLSRREVIFRQSDFRRVNWQQLMEALKKAQSPSITAKALEGAKNNGAFFREILDQRLNGKWSDGEPLRVVVVITSSSLFKSGSDLRPLQIEGECNCRVYYVRFRLTIADVFDELEKFMKPLHPRTFNVITARDLRKAIAEIVDDLNKL